jgi:hypothetical protein
MFKHLNNTMSRKFLQNNRCIFDHMFDIINIDVTSYDLVKRGSREQFLSEKLLTNLSYKTLTPFYELQDDNFSLGMIILMLTLKV